MSSDRSPIPSAAPALDKKQAVEKAITQIERVYGKGSIMRLGDRTQLSVDVLPTGSIGLDLALGVGELSRYMALNLPVKQLSLYISWPKRKSWAERLPISMPNTRLTQAMPTRWVWIRIIC